MRGKTKWFTCTLESEIRGDDGKIYHCNHITTEGNNPKIRLTVEFNVVGKFGITATDVKVVGIEVEEP